MNYEELATLAHILKPQGNKGELRATLEVDTIEPLIKFCEKQNILYAKNSSGDYTRPLKVEHFWQHSKGFGIFKFFEINSIEEALTLVGCDLLIKEKDRWQLSNDSFYVDQIIGLEVKDSSNNNSLGKIKEVISLPANDLYVVSNSERTFYLPAVKEFIRNVNIEKGFIEVIIPDGLIEINN